jgi:hypothetical protein
METLQELLEKDLTHLAGSLRDEFNGMEGSNLLITGGAGFLGYYLVQSVRFWNARHAAGRPIHVTVVDNYRRGVPDWLTGLRDNPHLSLVEHDISLPLPWREGIKGRGKQRGFLGGSKINFLRRRHLTNENHL